MNYLIKYTIIFFSVFIVIWAIYFIWVVPNDTYTGCGHYGHIQVSYEIRTKEQYEECVKLTEENCRRKPHICSQKEEYEKYFRSE